MKVTARLLLGIIIALVTMPTPARAVSQKETSTGTDALIEAHEMALVALQSERAKLRLEKATLFNVISLGRDLRNVESRIATRPIERVAALNRFCALIRDLEADAKTPLDRKMLDAEKAQADADLKIAKRDTVQIEQINKQERFLILERRRDLWRKDLDGSPPVHPVLPPKLAEKRR